LYRNKYTQKLYSFMKKTLSRTVLIGTTVVAAMVLAAPALAFNPLPPDDVQPPTWRGLPNTTSEYWQFFSSTNWTQPDGSLSTNTGWLPSTHITIDSTNQWIPSDTASGRFGIWSLTGTMDVTVDNYPTQNLEKLMWVQVVWQPMSGVTNTGPILSGFQPQGTTPVAVGPVALTNGWFETTYKWELFPNPAEESFVLGGNINVDQVIIDTWCIPEPSALLLATAGGGLLLVLRWRRQR
jgi:hypothetical protein